MTKEQVLIGMDLLYKDPDAVLMTRLSWAVNDISNLLYLHELRTKDQPTTEKRKSLKSSSGAYISKLLVSHLVEAVTVLADLEKSPKIPQLIASDADLKKHWERAKELLPTGKLSGLINVYARLRGNTTFHYCENGKELQKAFDQTMKDQPRWRSSYYAGDKNDHLCHFQLGDDLLDACFLRACGEEYAGENVTAVADRLAKQRDEAIEAFCQFAHLLERVYLKPFEIEG